jgi:hypothetical protein
MKKRSAVLLAAACQLAIAAWAVGADKPSVDRTISIMPEVATEGLTTAQSTNIQVDVSNWLAAERPSGVDGSAVRVSLSAAEIDAIEHPQATNAAPLKVGVVVPMTNQLAINGLLNPKTGAVSRNPNIAGGQLSRTRTGEYIWAVNVGSEGAGGIRLHIENLFLPNNAELYFYSDNGESYGPYTGMGPENNGDMWTPSIVGDEGTLQLRLNPPVTKADLANVSLSVTEVGHISRNFFGIAPNANAEGGVASFCSFNAPCIVNNNCTSDPAVNNAELAVAKMLWVQGCCIYTCSGGLIADSDAGTQIPYFMTAGHCLSQSNSGLEAFFHYEVSCGTSTCTATFTDPPNTLISGKTVGATVKAQGSISSGDYCLLQLSQAPPAGSVFLGWTNVAVSGSNGTPLYRVSHPSGAPQAFSNQNVNTSAGTCQGWPRGPLIYSTGNVGATEGGSSGSPVVNSSGQLVGQLTGGCGTNLNDECDHAHNATVDGAFAFYYNAVAPFLVGGGGGCGASGTSCTSNAQCCSNRCKPNGTCR